MELKDVIASILRTKQDLSIKIAGERAIPGYPSPWVVRRALSFFPENALFLQDLNAYPDTDPLMEYDYLRLVLPKRAKTFMPWIKPEQDDDIDVIKRYYNYSDEKAEEAKKLLSPEQMKAIRDYFFEGGVVKKSEKKS